MIACSAIDENSIDLTENIFNPDYRIGWDYLTNRLICHKKHKSAVRTLWWLSKGYGIYPKIQRHFCITSGHELMQQVFFTRLLLIKSSTVNQFLRIVWRNWTCKLIHFDDRLSHWVVCGLMKSMKLKAI